MLTIDNSILPFHYCIGLVNSCKVQFDLLPEACLCQTTTAKCMYTGISNTNAIDNADSFDCEGWSVLLRDHQHFGFGCFYLESSESYPRVVVIVVTTTILSVISFSINNLTQGIDVCNVDNYNIIIEDAILNGECSDYRELVALAQRTQPVCYSDINSRVNVTNIGNNVTGYISDYILFESELIECRGKSLIQ